MSEVFLLRALLFLLNIFAKNSQKPLCKHQSYKMCHDGVGARLHSKYIKCNRGRSCSWIIVRHVARSRCQRLCQQGPNIGLQPQNSCPHAYQIQICSCKNTSHTLLQLDALQLLKLSSCPNPCPRQHGCNQTTCNSNHGAHICWRGSKVPTRGDSCRKQKHHTRHRGQDQLRPE